MTIEPKKPSHWREGFSDLKKILLRASLGMLIFLAGLFLVVYIGMSSGRTPEELAYEFWVEIGIGISFTGIIIAYSVNSYLATQDREKQRDEDMKIFKSQQEQLLEKIVAHEAKIDQLVNLLSDRAKDPTRLPKPTAADEELIESYIPESNI